jgi:hypothetical protein
MLFYVHDHNHHLVHHKMHSQLNCISINGHLLLNHQLNSSSSITFSHHFVIVFHSFILLSALFVCLTFYLTLCDSLSFLTFSHFAFAFAFAFIVFTWFSLCLSFPLFLHYFLKRESFWLVFKTLDTVFSSLVLTSISLYLISKYN